MTTEQTNGIRSVDLRPGQAMRHVDSGAVVVLDRRKAPDESHLPGWWVRDGNDGIEGDPRGGLADAVIDNGAWVVVHIDRSGEAS